MEVHANDDDDNGVQRLISLDGTVDIRDEGERADESDESKHHEEGVGNDSSVAEVERQLQNSFHIRAVEEVEERVAEDEQAGRAAVHQSTPPPSGEIQG